MDHAHEEMGVQPEGLPATAILGMVMGIVIALALVVAVGVQIAFGQFKAAEVDAIEWTGYPLQRETASRAQALLSQNEAIDASQDTYRIPIERAMELVVAESGASSTSEITLSR